MKEVQKMEVSRGLGITLIMLVVVSMTMFALGAIMSESRHEKCGGHEQNVQPQPPPVPDAPKPPTADTLKEGEEKNPESRIESEMRWDDERRALSDCLNLARMDLTRDMSEKEVLAIVKKYTVTPDNVHLVREPDVRDGTLYGSNYPPEGAYSRVYDWTRELWLTDKDNYDRGTWLSNLRAYFENGKLSDVTLEYRYANPSKFKFLEEDERKK